jgi:hypothetical protein
LKPEKSDMTTGLTRPTWIAGAGNRASSPVGRMAPAASETLASRRKWRRSIGCDAKGLASVEDANGIYAPLRRWRLSDALASRLPFYDVRSADRFPQLSVFTYAAVHALQRKLRHR